MLIARLETDNKYYEISIVKDLLQDTVLVCYYGSKRTRFSRCKNIVIDSIDQGLKLAAKNITLRERHGYHLTSITPQLKSLCQH